ncbi:hypothetical protein PTI45_03211 [Paenibacillus nuruki]|uniref:Pre-toxin TG domain-containing protein n=2 Tax=Paenibacillus nuruki TaxID=1886670 RepID=A0A1E3L2L1_9BACL|nr:hypothetical protein PTI45_03211 [Paenibacillus nuruki]
MNRDFLSGSIDDGLTMNRYVNVNGNPISYIDPFGLSADSDELLKTVGSFLVDAVPGLGTLKGLQEIFTGVNYVTGDQLSVADRVANGGGVLLSWVPGGKIAGKALTKGAIDGGSWVIARVAKTPGKYLESPAEINGMLNIGARGRPIEGTYNIDIDPKSQGVHYGDANQLTNIKTGSQNKIIIENPYGYDPLNSEILRVLSKDGEIIITGSGSNMKKILRQLEDKGLQVKGERRDIANDGTYLTTDGEIIKSEFLDQYIFVRK